MESVKVNPLASAPVSKLMIKFGIPSIVAMLVGALYNIVDQLFIGNSVGTLGNAATNVAFPLSISCISLALLFGVGAASCFNLHMGSGDKEKAPYFIGNGTTMLIVSGILLMLVTNLFLDPMLKVFGSPDDVFPLAREYVKITAYGFPFLILTTGGGHLMRADGSPKMTMICSLLGAVINTVLDALFVMKFGWGMAGAAYATIIGQIISGIMVIVYLFRFKTVTLELKHFMIKFNCIFKIMSIGMASFINQIAMMIVQIVLNNSLKKYGAQSEFGDSIPIACAGIIMKISQIVFAIIIGLGQGAQPIESFNYGAKQYKRVREAYGLAMKIGAVIAIASFVVFQIFPEQIISFFGKGSEEYYRFGVSFFRIFLFFMWLSCIQPITSIFFTSIGKPVKGAVLSLTRNIIFFIPPLLILPHFFGINGILYTGPIADFLAAAVNIILAVWEFKIMKKQEQKFLLCS